MRRTAPIRRLIAGLSGLWLIVALLEPVPLHACAMHEAMGHHGGAAGAPAATSMTGGRDHHAMAPMAGGHDHHAAAPESPKPTKPAPSNVCTCLGDCAGAAAVQLPALPTLAFAPVEVRTAIAVPAPDAVALSAHPDVRLPFPNGPPVSSLS